MWWSTCNVTQNWILFVCFLLCFRPKNTFHTTNTFLAGVATSIDRVSVIKRKKGSKNSDRLSCFFCQSSAGDRQKTSTKKKPEQRLSVITKTWWYKLCWITSETRLISNKELVALELKWHKPCYCTFTSKSKVTRLRQKRQPSTKTSARFLIILVSAAY